jgi:hypothetical protein
LSFSNTYAHTLAFTLDVAGALIFWNQSDITISSLCWVVMMSDMQGEHYSTLRGVDYHAKLDGLKLYGWQTALLRHIGPQLDRIQPNHRELAREADLARAARVTALLQ